MEDKKPKAKKNSSDDETTDEVPWDLAATAAANKVMATKFKKSPDAPKRFKSAFILFSSEKHKEIKQKLIDQGEAKKTTDIAKLVAASWRDMEPEERALWDEKARKDKARYEMEKSMYKGPWKVPAMKRSTKDPSAPKRPSSAFLSYSNKRRASLKKEYPLATNADLSKMLSKSWKEESPEVRNRYLEEEKQLRDQYKIEIGNWRKKVSEEKKKEREEREAIAMYAAESKESKQASTSSAVGHQPSINAATLSVAARLPSTVSGFDQGATEIGGLDDNSQRHYQQQPNMSDQYRHNLNSQQLQSFPGPNTLSRLGSATFDPSVLYANFPERYQPTNPMAFQQQQQQHQILQPPANTMAFQQQQQQQLLQQLALEQRILQRQPQIANNFQQPIYQGFPGNIWGYSSAQNSQFGFQGQGGQQMGNINVDNLALQNPLLYIQSRDNTNLQSEDSQQHDNANRDEQADLGDNNYK